MQLLVKRWPKCPACRCYIEPNGKFHIDFVALEIVALHEGKEEGMILDEGVGTDYSYVPPL